MPCGAEIHRSKTFVRNVQNVCRFRKFFVVFSIVDKCAPVGYNVTKFKRRYKEMTAFSNAMSDCCMNTNAVAGTSARRVVILDTVILAVSILITLICVLPTCA